MLRHCFKSGDTSFFAMFCQKAGPFLSMNVKPFLAFYTSAQRITVMKSRIPHPDAGLNLLASRTITKSEIAGTTIAL